LPQRRSRPGRQGSGRYCWWKTRRVVDSTTAASSRKSSVAVGSKRTVAWPSFLSVLAAISFPENWNFQCFGHRLKDLYAQHALLGWSLVLLDQHAHRGCGPRAFGEAASERRVGAFHFANFHRPAIDGTNKKREARHGTARCSHQFHFVRRNN